MTQLLIQGAVILAQGPFAETADEIQSSDAIYPKHVIDGWQIVDVTVPADFTCADYIWNGTTAVAKPPVVLSPTIKEYTDSVQSLLDTTAQTRNYDSILSACTYVTSTDPKFKAEGQACVQWRDSVWSQCYSVMAQVQGGTLAQPTVAELVAMMPSIVWPI